MYSYPLEHQRKIHGFTLLEMAIVVAIIGLIISGVVVAQSMVRSSQVQGAMKELVTFRQAIITFREKYNYWPGDMPNATSFWPADPDGNCTSPYNASPQVETCNGGGDEWVHTSAGDRYEMFTAWQHLANAGLIDGTYSGSGSGDGATTDYLIPNIGVSCPRSVTGAGFKIDSITPHGIAATQSIYVTIGTVNSGYPLWGAVGPIFRPEEALQIDTKMDDGLPVQGYMGAFVDINSSCATGGSSSPAATYNVADTGIRCGMWLTIPFQ
ncbi:MAG: type II secretion system protein [Rickettsiales bacterium]|nr:type II secretion system protein [Rickettsiales bacterium]